MMGKVVVRVFSNLFKCDYVNSMRISPLKCVNCCNAQHFTCSIFSLALMWALDRTGELYKQSKLYTIAQEPITEGLQWNSKVVTQLQCTTWTHNGRGHKNVHSNRLLNAFRTVCVWSSFSVLFPNRTKWLAWHHSTKAPLFSMWHISLYRCVH